MYSFSDFAKERPLSGSKLPIGAILDKEIILKAYRITASKFSDSEECLTLQYELNGEEHVTFTSSKVLIDLIRKYQENLPFKTTLVKINKYITMT